MGKKMIARNLSAALAALMTVAAAGASAEMAKVRMGIASNEIASFCPNTGLIHEPAFAPFSFKDANVELTNILLSVSQSPVAVNNGDVDMGECAGVAVLAQAYKKGARNVVLVLAGSVKPSYVLIGASKFKALTDLKGGNVGAPGPQSTAAEAIEVILQRGAGLMPDRDYKVISTGTGAARMAAIAAGRIDAISSYPPLSYKMVDDGLNQLADEIQYVPRYASGSMLVNRDWARQHSDVVVAVLKVLIETGQWLKNPASKDAVIASLAQHITIGQPGMGEAYARRYYADIIERERVAFDGYADAATITASLDLMSGLGFLDKADYPPLAEIVDYSYLNLALKELGLPQVKLLAGK
jgi:ABC-type nitrate/sulfonate/bicarbonate transport system substrate-binding protein